MKPEVLKSWTLEVDYSRAPCLGADQKTHGLWERDCIKRDASGKNGKLSCCKCIFNQIKANLAEIQPENRQNVQKMRFLQKAPGVNGLSLLKKS